MSKSGTDQDRKSPLRALIPALLILIVTISSSTGCIDKGIVDSLVEIVEGDDGPGYVWESLLSEKGNFVLEAEGDTDPDFPTIIRKVTENITSFDPTQTLTNMKKIMNEENLSMRKYPFTFYVIEGTRNLNIELTGIFKTSVGESAPAAGYMEITIINPLGKSDTIEITQFQEEDKYIYPYDPISGKWVVELQGLGLQSPADLVYSGEYIITVRAEMPKES